MELLARRFDLKKIFTDLFVSARIDKKIGESGKVRRDDDMS
jgi:hypothetical protein